MSDELSEVKKLIIDHMNKIFDGKYYNEYRKVDIVNDLKKTLEAHYFLLTEARKTNIEKNEEFRKAVEWKEEMIRKEFEEMGYFSKEKLRSMTIGELSDLIYKENE